MRLKSNSQGFNEHKEKVMLDVSRWSHDAACKSIGVSEFYDAEDHNLKKTAAKYCFSCPVQNQCLYTAIIFDEEYGVWGGFTPRQRRLFKKKLLSLAKQKGLNIFEWSEELSTFFRANTQIQKVKTIFES